VRTRRIFAACLLCWSVMIVAALVAAHWLALIALFCLPSIAGVIAALVVTVHTRLTRGRAELGDQGDDAGNAPLQVPHRAPLAPPRRRARPFRADPPAPPPISGPDAGAVARGEQEVMRQRTAAGETDPGLDAFLALMRGAGAADLEDVAAPDDDQPGGPL
jgi:hypothetical protein